MGTQILAPYQGSDLDTGSSQWAGSLTNGITSLIQLCELRLSKLSSFIQDGGDGLSVDKIRIVSKLAISFRKLKNFFN